MGTHQGDMPDLGIISHLSGGSGRKPMITVSEIKRGTSKEVQTITTVSNSGSVNPTSSFKLKFRGETTNPILALPIEGTTCLGSTRAKQIITTSTEDTSGEGGDKSVSPQTSFVISYESYSTSPIEANTGTCEEKASTISDELGSIPLLKEVEVVGVSSDEDSGCMWTITLLSVQGNPNLLEGKFMK